VPADDEPALVRHLLHQADACADLGSPLYARLLRACVDDWRAGGPVREVLAGYEDAPGPAATGIRLLGGVHHLVLTGHAPRLARQYPSTGGAPDHDLVAAFLQTVADQVPQLRRSLLGPPQTNEVARSAALVGGLLRVLDGRDLPVRLHEIGSSAGLNLNADRYRYQVGTTGSWWGPVGSRLTIPDAWRGAAPAGDAPLRVVERVGSDVAPVDVRDPGATDRLLSYVWPDQVARVERLRAALAVAAEHPVSVDRLAATAAVERLDLRPGHLTVLWHSVMWQYLSREEQATVTATLDELGRTATADAPLVRLSLEPERPRPDAEHQFLVAATTWPGATRTVLGVGAPHGVPTRWLP
jgi:hypothetical protein